MMYFYVVNRLFIFILFVLLFVIELFRLFILDLGVWFSVLRGLGIFNGFFLLLVFLFGIFVFKLEIKVSDT